jgi:hypothetical protein
VGQYVPCVLQWKNDIECSYWKHRTWHESPLKLFSFNSILSTQDAACWLSPSVASPPNETAHTHIPALQSPALHTGTVCTACPNNCAAPRTARQAGTLPAVGRRADAIGAFTRSRCMHGTLAPCVRHQQTMWSNTAHQLPLGAHASGVGSRYHQVINSTSIGCSPLHAWHPRTALRKHGARVKVQSAVPTKLNGLGCHVYAANVACNTSSMVMHRDMQKQHIGPELLSLQRNVTVFTLDSG